MVGHTRRVAIYRATHGKPSETFIRAQASAMSTYQPIHIGWRTHDDHEATTSGVVLGWNRGNALRLALGRPAPTLVNGLARIAPRLVHAHFGPDWVQVQPAADRLGLPTVATLHGFDVFNRPVNRSGLSPQWASYLWLRRGRVGRPERVVCVSDFVLEAARRCTWLDGGRLIRHHIGIDTARVESFASPDTRHNLVFVGRLVEKKGVDDFVEVVDYLRHRGVTNPVRVIGDGPLRHRVEALVARHPDVDWLGSQPHEVVLGELGRALLAIQPSKTARSGDAESLGLVFAEAISAGAGVVGYVHGGVPEVVPRQLLVGEGDCGRLAELACSIVREPARYHDILAERREWLAKHFDLHHQTAELEELYDDVAA